MSVTHISDQVLAAISQLEELLPRLEIHGAAGGCIDDRCQCWLNGFAAGEQQAKDTVEEWNERPAARDNGQALGC